MSAAGSVHLIGALDTKGAEYGFVRDRLMAAGIPVTLVDTGVLGTPAVVADISREEVAAAADTDVERLASSADRNLAVQAMAAGAAAVVAARRRVGALSGVLVLGGSHAGHVMSRVAAALPLGCPKLLVSTIVAGDTRPYVGTSDLVMMYPVVDIAGLNSVSVPVLAQAADAMIGMLHGAAVPAVDRTGLSVGCTMFGVTTACVSAVQGSLEQRGDEVQVFHATGTGGRTCAARGAAGAFEVGAYLTTPERADELVGGVCSAGPERLTAAGRRGIPQVVSVGAIDMANFGPVDTVPERFRERRLLAHNPSVTLMRTDAAENAELGRILAARLNAAAGFVELHVPALGFSQISAPGGPFHDPAADRALIDAVRADLDDRIPLHVHDLAINDPAFADQIVAALDRARSHSEKGE